MTDKRRVKTLQNMGIVALILISLYISNQLFGTQIRVFKSAVNSILLPFGIALFLSYLLSPLINLLKNRLKIKNMLLNVLIVFLVLIIVGGLFFFYIGTIIYKQGISFIENDWESIRLWFEIYVSENTYLAGVADQISQYISFENASPLIFNVVNVVRGIGSVTVVIVLIPVFLFFLLKEKETIFQGILNIVPNKYDYHTKNLGIRANDVIQKYFNGRFLSMFIMSIIFTIVFWIFGFDFQRSLFFGFTIGFLDIIPYVGGFIGILLPILYSFTVLPEEFLFGTWTFAALIGANVILQGFQGNLLQPYIMGKEVNMHPLLVLTSFIFFGALFGITGIILAIPITGIIKTSVEYFSELKEAEESMIKTVISEPITTPAPNQKKKRKKTTKSS